MTRSELWKQAVIKRHCEIRDKAQNVKEKASCSDKSILRKKLDNLLKNGFKPSELTEIEKMYRGEAFNKNDEGYKKLVRLSREACAEHNFLISQFDYDDRRFIEAEEKISSFLFPIRGENVTVCYGIEVIAGTVSLGSSVYLNTNVHFKEGVNVTIGSNILCAVNVTFGELRDTSAPCGKEIIIGDDNWICANSVIYENVKIGSRNVIGMGTHLYSGTVIKNDSLYKADPSSAYGAKFDRIVTQNDIKTGIVPKEFFTEGEMREIIASLSKMSAYSPCPSKDFYLMMMRKSKYNCLDGFVIKNTTLTRKLCAQYNLSKDKADRERLLRMLFPIRGRNCSVGDNICIECAGQVILGDNVRIGNNVTLFGNVRLGSNVVIGDNSAVIGMEHERFYSGRQRVRLLDTEVYIVITNGVVIDDNCVIGENTCIAPGCHITENIGSNQLVMHCKQC